MASGIFVYLPAGDLMLPHPVFFFFTRPARRPSTRRRVGARATSFAASSRCAREGHGRGGKEGSSPQGRCFLPPRPSLPSAAPQKKHRTRQAFAYFAAHNTTVGTFGRPFLCGAAAGGAACLLRKLVGNEDSPFFRLIAEFAGVQSGPEAIRHTATLSAP